MKRVLLAIGVMTLSACAHYPDVRPGTDGVHRVVVSAEDPDSGNKNALAQAKDYCEDSDKRVAIVSESQKYVGKMKEDEYISQKQTSKAIESAGKSMSVFGAESTKGVGAVLSKGGTIASDSLGKAYVVEMTFKCL